ncbi:hypothetical protein CW745_13765 [Psychromonas sp. psych-6C06]|uniref:SulA-like leucine-rich domain-containing protein n=1 Tax=Psychromonas sp. psych-6C06 TaxID=2058089 RepID=UPI000C34F7DF|nr:SulA-like leucine-rich domain-containing protein [Psychromonas sp. psych-6C06]PKF60594.1 hypothetical protein CW745_13765 [Psychromonas sp. psych-6C06]
MLSRFQQQASNALFTINGSVQQQVHHNDRLTLSYDLNNYQALLSHLQESDDPRWILFIAPPGKPNFQFLQQAGINKSRIITLSSKQIKTPEKLFKEALASNNYAAVIRWVNSGEQPSVDEVNQLTERSKTHCFVYCAQ